MRFSRAFSCHSYSDVFWLAFRLMSMHRQGLARVLDGEDSRPVFGALTYLVDSEGTVLKNALTDQLGRALFVGLEAGAFRVRVEMIGKATVETDLFQVAAGATATQDVRLESSAIVLEGLQVEAEGGRCRVRPSQGLGGSGPVG
ncbi:MAG: hypothetical protein CM1200mP14_14720 [Gammaproteobacteria bacterium]|nr:MAG: hypothetical protein CM1200mP14_14720 [Gammaproteobacteria bacterium]